MSETIIVALLSFAGVVISNLITHSKSMYRIEQLEKKQDKHNDVIDRTYKAESRLDVIETNIEAIKDDIKEIKEGA